MGTPHLARSVHMKSKIAAALPFAVTLYLVGALILFCYPPWIINQGQGATGRIFEGYALLWNRSVHTATNGLLDWSSLVAELLTWMTTVALLVIVWIGLADLSLKLQAYFGRKTPDDL